MGDFPARICSTILRVSPLCWTDCTKFSSKFCRVERHRRTWAICEAEMIFSPALADLAWIECRNLSLSRRKVSKMNVICSCKFGYNRIKINSKKLLEMFTFNFACPFSSTFILSMRLCNCSSFSSTI